MSTPVCSHTPTYLTTLEDGQPICLSIDVCNEVKSPIIDPSSRTIAVYNPLKASINTTLSKVQSIGALIAGIATDTYYKVRPHLTSMVATGFIGATAYVLMKRSSAAFNKGNRSEGWYFLAGSVGAAAICAINISSFNIDTQII